MTVRCATSRSAASMASASSRSAPLTDSMSTIRAASVPAGCERSRGTAAQPLTGLADELAINIDGEGRFYVGKLERSPEALEQELRAAANRYADQSVIIRGEADGPYQHVMTVLNICHRAGITNLRLANRALTGTTP